jgi:hypothetical protein
MEDARDREYETGCKRRKTQKMRMHEMEGVRDRGCTTEDARDRRCTRQRTQDTEDARDGGCTRRMHETEVEDTRDRGCTRQRTQETGHEKITLVDALDDQQQDSVEPEVEVLGEKEELHGCT